MGESNLTVRCTLSQAAAKAEIDGAADGHNLKHHLVSTAQALILQHTTEAQALEKLLRFQIRQRDGAISNEGTSDLLDESQ